jgi:hypothetical protein
MANHGFPLADFRHRPRGIVNNNVKEVSLAPGKGAPASM